MCHHKVKLTQPIDIFRCVSISSTYPCKVRSLPDIDSISTNIHKSHVYMDSTYLILTQSLGCTAPSHPIICHLTLKSHTMHQHVCLKSVFLKSHGIFFHLNSVLQKCSLKVQTFQQAFHYIAISFDIC